MSITQSFSSKTKSTPSMFPFPSVLLWPFLGPPTFPASCLGGSSGNQNEEPWQERQLWLQPMSFYYPFHLSFLVLPFLRSLTAWTSAGGRGLGFPQPLDCATNGLDSQAGSSIGGTCRAHRGVSCHLSFKKFTAFYF